MKWEKFKESVKRVGVVAWANRRRLVTPEQLQAHLRKWGVDAPLEELEKLLGPPPGSQAKEKPKPRAPKPEPKPVMPEPKPEPEPAAPVEQPDEAPKPKRRRTTTKKRVTEEE